MSFLLGVFVGVVIGMLLTGMFVFGRVPNYTNGLLCVSCHIFDRGDGHMLCEHHGPTAKHRLMAQQQKEENAEHDRQRISTAAAKKEC